MKKFNEFAEHLLITANPPESDSVGPVQTQACPCKAKDMLTQTVDDVLGNIQQPTDGIGEYGQIGGDGIGDYSKDGVGEYGTEEGGEASDVDLECMGEQGLKVKFNDMEILLPKRVIDKIKEFVGAEAEEHEDETESETEEHETEETPEEETEEHKTEDAEPETEDDDEPKNESVKDPKAVCAASMKIGKKKGKGTEAAQAKRKGKFEKCVQSVSHKK